MVNEIGTVVTDYLLGVSALFSSLQLYKKYTACPSNTVLKVWSWSFCSIAVSAILGGSFHGFAPTNEENASLRAYYWIAVMVSLILSSFCISTAYAFEVVPQKYSFFFIFLLLIKLIYFCWLTLYRPVFFTVLVDYGSSLLLWFCTAVAFYPGRSWCSLMIICGILSAVSGVIQQYKYNPFDRNEWFNHNDLYHLVQLVANYFLYCSAWKMGEHASKKNT